MFQRHRSAVAYCLCIDVLVSNISLVLMNTIFCYFGGSFSDSFMKCHILKYFVLCIVADILNVLPQLS